ncbi:hypothetical protein [Burkholderia sp. PR2]|uniref:hypothetical protein n=1 Tax=Burkholderia sp. PR2 TaxID=3448078 RepID=UPI00402AB73D
MNRFNRQLHPQEKALAKQLAEKSKGKYTQAQIEDQMRIMGVSVNGSHESEAPVTLVGETPTDLGAQWIGGKPTADGQMVLTHKTAPNNPELQSYILANTDSATPGQVPSQFRYDRSANSDYNFTLTGPFTRLPNQSDWNYIRSTTGDLASATSITAGWLGATTGALVSAPTPLAPTFAGISYATTVVGVGADAVGQALSPNIGQYRVGGGVNILSNYVSGKYPIIGPVVNANGNTLNNDHGVAKVQSWINSYWQAVSNSISTNGGKGAKN